jgi:hypothetical protein
MPDGNMVKLDLTPAEARAIFLHCSYFNQEDAEAFESAVDQLYSRMADADADVSLPNVEPPSQED